MASTLIPAYTGLLDDIHITTLVGEIWQIPITDRAHFVAENVGVDIVTQPVTFTVQRQQAFDAIVALQDSPNAEARVLALIAEWQQLPPSGWVHMDKPHLKLERMVVGNAKLEIARLLRGIYGVRVTGFNDGQGGMTPGL